MRLTPPSSACARPRTTMRSWPSWATCCTTCSGSGNSAGHGWAASTRWIRRQQICERRERHAGHV